MLTKLVFQVGIVVIAVVLTFAPVFAQDAAPADRNANDQRVAAADDNGPDLGWLGLIGLVGLGGLMRKDKRDYRHDERAANR